MHRKRHTERGREKQTERARDREIEEETETDRQREIEKREPAIETTEKHRHREKRSLREPAP